MDGRLGGRVGLAYPHPVFGVILSETKDPQIFFHTMEILRPRLTRPQNDNGEKDCHDLS